MLLRHFMEKKGDAAGKRSISLSEEALDCLCRYNWPGNVRELENLIERLVVLGESEIIELQDLPSEISSLYDINANDSSRNLINIDESGRIATLEEYEREIITHALKRFGSFNATGKALGITHKTVATKAKKYNIIDKTEYDITP